MFAALPFALPTKFVLTADAFLLSPRLATLRSETLFQCFAEEMRRALKAFAFRKLASRCVTNLKKLAILPLTNVFRWHLTVSTKL